MKNKGTGIQWHRIFGIAALMSVIVFAVMLYMDFGTSIKSMVGIVLTLQQYQCQN